MYRVFIDGQEGTTGLEIRQRLEKRDDIELVLIDDSLRKDPAAKKECINEADLVILCLPDDIARQSVGLVENSSTRIIDASTAHRTNPDWVYGLPELSHDPFTGEHTDWAEKIANARFVANPGCYPTGFVLMVNPLVGAGVLPRDYPVTVHALSGYSGGGKKLIQLHNSDGCGQSKNLACRPYGFSLEHKHQTEMKYFGGLSHTPLFSPSVGDFYRGMLVHVPMFSSFLQKNSDVDEIRAILDEAYENQVFVRVMGPPMDQYLDQGFLSPLGCNHTNRVDIFVWGSTNHILLTACLDNLGKGAAGAAIQNLNLMLGCDPQKSLTVESPFEHDEDGDSIFSSEKISAYADFVRVYTDGSSINNPGAGGYGIVIQAGENQYEFSRGYQHTTNNRMEMMAVIVALENLQDCREKEVTVYSDSQYTINGIVKGWAKSWKRRNWKKSDGKPALNPDLWAKLLDLTEGFSCLQFQWVKGHAGNPLNERADALANSAARQSRDEQFVDDGYLPAS